MTSRSTLAIATAFAGMALTLSACLEKNETTTSVAAAADALPIPTNLPPALATVRVPEPADLAAYVADKGAAIALGKALFWDMQIGSDGKTACATCHFNAGADSRTRN